MEKYYAVNKDSNSDALKHWKYIRKEWDPSGTGHWKYYYKESKYAKGGSKNIFTKGLSKMADKLGVDERQAYRENREVINANTAAMLDQDRMIKEAKTGTGRYANKKWDSKKHKEIYIHNLQVDRQTYKDGMNSAKSIRDEIRNDYMSTPLYKIERAGRKIKKGMRYLKRKLGL